MELTKYIDNQKVNEKLDLEAIKKLIPTVEDLTVILCATKEPRKRDEWIDEGKRYVRIILDYNRTLYSKKEFIINHIASLLKNL